MNPRIPDTQRKSWELCQIEGLSEKLAKVRNVLVRNGPCTTFEIADILAWSVHMVSGKITNLQDQGLVKRSGRMKLRETANFKRHVTVWEACREMPRPEPTPCPHCDGTGILTEEE